MFVGWLFGSWLAPAQIDSYIAGLILLAAAPCTAMVFVWSNLTDGDPNLYGASPVKELFWFIVTSLFGAGKGLLRPVAWRSGSRSARKGSRDRMQQSLAACRLAALVFRSALTPEHAKG